MLCFVMATKLQFFTCQLLFKLFEYNILFGSSSSKLTMKEIVHAKTKIGLPLRIADCLSDCPLYCSSPLTYLPAVKSRSVKPHFSNISYINTSSVAFAYVKCPNKLSVCQTKNKKEGSGFSATLNQQQGAGKVIELFHNTTTKRPCLFNQTFINKVVYRLLI